MQSPTAVPRIPASASGVSTQRSAPNRYLRPAVARKTPPSWATSSPSTSTFGSRSISTWSASFTASTSRRSLIAEDPPELGEGVREGRERLRVGVRADEQEGRRRLGLRLRDPGPHQLERAVPDLRRLLSAQQAEALEVALVLADALVLARLLDPLLVDVERGIVRGRVRGSPVGDRLDERGPLAAAGSGDRLAGGVVNREHVVAVHPNGGNPVADRLVCERRRRGLLRERRRDRPLVVVAEEDDRRLHDSRERRALVERALGGRAVAK